MYPSQLKINTTFGANLTAGSSQTLPARRARSRSPLRGPRVSTGAAHRTRSASTASVSSLSKSSQAAPSTSASTSGLRIPQQSTSTAQETNARSPSLSSVDIDATVRVSATCLSFRAGQIIHVLNRDSSGWWDGELEGRRGWFPSNYVNPEVESLTEEQLPKSQNKRGHVYSASVASTASWGSTTSLETPQHRRQPSAPEPPGQDIDSYFPALMVPLLHSLSLLQTAVRANRTSHFPPSTACIISCVRSILSATGTLIRDAAVLQRHPTLAQERRRILSVLAALVSQAKKASEGASDNQNQEFEVESMLRLGGQVFANVRKFLGVAVECGIVLPDQRESTASLDTEGPSWRHDRDVSFDTPPISYGVDTLNGKTPTQTRLHEQEHMATAGSALHVKSMGNPRHRGATSIGDESDAMSLLPNRHAGQSKEVDYLHRFGHRFGALSVSSTSSSSSSVSSQEASSAPPFPSGPSTTAQVIEALRLTHDQYLSTIAAFIGHAHSHSRTSHASSTGHLYDLVREIVEMVCKLLTIVEAVMQHPGVPVNRLGNLKFAKDGLYNVTSTLAESVRLLTLSLPPTMTEDEEKQTLLRSATSALKAGADCVAAVKVCLNRAVGERPFIIDLPTGDDGSQPFTPSKFSRLQSIRATSMNALQGYPVNGMNDEDLTIQAVTPSPVRRPRDMSSSSEESAVSKSSSVPSVDTAATTPDETKHRPSSFIISRAPVEADLPSPTSIVRTDDGTTWEGSIQSHGHQGVEDKPYDDPADAFDPELNPEFLQDPTAWMLSHDYSLEDVAYNTDGHLVGATIDVLVEKITPHDNLVDAAFSAVFFLTFRLFSSPVELVDTIITRYNIQPPKGISEADIQFWQQRKGVPVRLRVSNFIKSWVEMYWRPGVDDPALPALTLFVRNELALYFPAPAQRILELITLRRQTSDFTISPKGDRSRDPGMSINPPSAILLTSEVPRPTMTKTLLVALRKKDYASITVTDFDALELARQLTIMECNLYCAIQPEEILEMGSEGAKSPVNVRAVSSLSTVITGWVAESILDEPDLKKRTALVRFFIKVADGVPQKYKSQMESLRRLADHSRNYHEYRSKLRNTAPPAVPFLGLYLTDVTFCREGNPSHRASPINPSKKLLNFNKYHKLARIIQDMQRFQVPYNLKAIPEVQGYLNVAFENARHHGDLQDLYRRSLLVEPRQPADTAPTSDVRQLFNWATRSQSQNASSSQ
ncbi:hypothetical protein DXG01_011964 [Tephrocybe rancida]|nr:hypothetical protein DXG01_011964 [Tephrocybe rancida]